MTEKATKKNIQQYLLAGFPFLWVRTLEPDRAIADLKAEIAALEDIEKKKRCVATWDCVSGVTEGDKANGQSDPIAPWKYLGSMPDDSVMFLVNYHRFINPIEIAETIRKSLDGENAINVKALTEAATSEYSNAITNINIFTPPPKPAPVPDKLDLWGCIEMRITVRGKSCPTYTVCPVVNEYCYGGIKTPMREEYLQVSRSIQKSKTEKEQIHIIDCDGWMKTNMKTGNGFGLVGVRADAQ